MGLQTIPLAELPGWALPVLIVLAVVQLTLQAVALVDLYRRPVERVVSDKKWPWVAAILLLSTGGIGAIVYLAAGRKPDQVSDPASAAAPVDGRRAIDALYGDRTDDGRS